MLHSLFWVWFIKSVLTNSEKSDYQSKSSFFLIINKLNWSIVLFFLVTLICDPIHSKSDFSGILFLILFHFQYLVRWKCSTKIYHYYFCLQQMPIQFCLNFLLLLYYFNFNDIVKILCNKRDSVFFTKLRF